MIFDLKKLKIELVKLFSYVCTGVVSVIVDCAVYYLLLNFADIDFRFIQPISLSCGLCSSFIINRGLVFKNEKTSIGREALKYMCVCIFSIVVSPLIISFYALWLGEVTVKIPATLTTGLINYLLNRFFVYNSKATAFAMDDEFDDKGNDNF